MVGGSKQKVLALCRGYFRFPTENINSIPLEKQGEALTRKVRAAPVPFTRTQEPSEELNLPGSTIQTQSLQFRGALQH